MRDKEWLDASIRHWVRIQQLVNRRVELLRELRAQLDTDLADLLRELDGDAVALSERKVDEKEETDDSNGSNGSNVSNVSNGSDENDEDNVDELVMPLVPEQAKLLTDENETRTKKVVNVSARKRKNRNRQVRGDRNPNRLLILKLTGSQPMTVPELQRELSAKSGKLSKQSVDNWVKKLLEEGLLSREDSPDPTSKNRYRRTAKADAAEQEGKP